MRDTLGWAIQGKTFQDGSTLADWQEIYKSDRWHWQYDSHELSYAIYQYDGQFWKLYHARYVNPGETDFSYGFGGQACRMVEVEYQKAAKSPHSNMPKSSGDTEWIRTYEYRADMHRVLTAGEQNEKYGQPYTEGK